MAGRAGLGGVLLPVDGQWPGAARRPGPTPHPPTALVSIKTANNERALQPIAELARLAHRAGACSTATGVQAVGKIPLDVPALGGGPSFALGHSCTGPRGWAV